jgi:hypothetical protein
LEGDPHRPQQIKVPPPSSTKVAFVMQWLNHKVVKPFKTSCSHLSGDAIAAALTAGVVGGIVSGPPRAIL